MASRKGLTMVSTRSLRPAAIPTGTPTMVENKTEAKTMARVVMVSVQNPISPINTIATRLKTANPHPENRHAQKARTAITMMGGTALRPMRNNFV